MQTNLPTYTLPPEPTFEQLWTKEAVQEILRDFEYFLGYNPYTSPYLCNVSKRFKLLWKDHSEDIRELAFKYLPFDTSRQHHMTLFMSCHRSDAILHRRSFLLHELHRLS